jgi:hypothetical protein
MSVQIKVSGNVMEVDREPDHCPICHKGIQPVFVTARRGNYTTQGYGARLEVLYLCPNHECDEWFIAYFHDSMPILSLGRTRPFTIEAPAFSPTIRDISKLFCNIYTEAYRAERYDLKQICGVGYRKALEFLIKDYIILSHPDDRAKIEAKPLGACIKDYVTDTRIRSVTERATWLGNDETHYQRRWVDKDLTDLKTMIRLVQHWIEAEHLTAEALRSMPDGRN